MLFQQPLQFVFEALLAMMFFLSLDVVGHFIERSGLLRTLTKDRIAVLPVKLLPRDSCDPSRPRFLELSNEVRNAMDRLESDEQMNMILDASDLRGTPSRPRMVPPRYW